MQKHHKILILTAQICLLIIIYKLFPEMNSWNIYLIGFAFNLIDVIVIFNTNNKAKNSIIDIQKESPVPIFTLLFSITFTCAMSWLTIIPKIIILFKKEK